MYFMKMIIITIIINNSAIKKTATPAPPIMTIDEVSVVIFCKNKNILYT